MKCMHCGGLLRLTARVCIPCGNAAGARVVPPSSAATSHPMTPPDPTGTQAGASPLAGSPSASTAPDSLGSRGGKFVIGVVSGVVGLGLLAGAGYLYLSQQGLRAEMAGIRGGPDSQATSPASPSARVPPASAPAPSGPGQRQVDRAFLNELLQGAREDNWNAIASLGRMGVPLREGESAPALREKAQNALDEQRVDVARGLVLEALLRDPRSGAAWLIASQVFAEQGVNDSAVPALKLAYFFARDRQQALASLRELARGPESRFRSVVLAVIGQIPAIPARQ